MITFYPNTKLDIWKPGEFSFGIHLAARNYAALYDRTGLLEYLKDHGVKLNEPLKIELDQNKEYGDGTYTVTQGSTLFGWILDCCR